MKVQVSHRLDEELLAWATEFGEARGLSRAVVIEEALRSFRELSRGGVPDLPAAEPRPAVEPRAAAFPARVVRARSLAPADPVSLARQARLNKERS